MRVAVLSDTHAPRKWKRCPLRVANELTGADVILHAGDMCTAEVLEELSNFAPVHAVLGNNDGADVAAWGAQAQLRLKVAGLPIAMIHDSGAASGRGRRLARLFPDEALVVFGHSHIPWNQVYAGQRAFNPGSPTDKRRQPYGTIGELVIEDGELVSARVIPVA